MFFIVLAKMKGELTPEFRKATQKTLKNPPSGLKIHNVFWTLGQYDFVIIYEAPNEKEALKIARAPEGTEVSEPKVEVVEEKLPEPPIERVEVKETDSFQAQQENPQEISQNTEESQSTEIVAEGEEKQET